MCFRLRHMHGCPRVSNPAACPALLRSTCRRCALNRLRDAARRLFESIHPLEDGLVAALDAPLAPLCAVAGLAFERHADAVSGPWRNYFIGLLGDVAADEVDVLWPNQASTGASAISTPAKQPSGQPGAKASLCAPVRLLYVIRMSTGRNSAPPKQACFR